MSYIPKTYTQITTTALSKLLARKGAFSDVELRNVVANALGSEGGILQKDIPLLICLYTKFISEELLVKYVDDTKRNDYYGIMLNELCKKGYLDTKSLGSYQSHTTKAFYLTKKGYDYATYLVQDGSPVPPYTRLSKVESRILHDYHLGANILSFLSIPDVKLEIYREIGIGNYTNINSRFGKGANVVYPDILCKFTRNKKDNIAYIEEDCLTETQDTLYDKLLAYSTEVLDPKYPNDLILFSFAKTGVYNLARRYGANSPFNRKNMISVLGFMKKYNINSTAAIGNYDDIEEFREQIRLKAEKDYSNANELDMGIDNYILTIKNLNMLYGFLDEDGDIGDKSKALNVSDIEKHIYELEHYSNAYMESGYLEPQYKAADVRFWNMIQKSNRAFTTSANDAEKLFRNYVYGGCQIFGGASHLMTRYIPYICPSDNMPYAKVMWILSYYHPLLRYFDNSVPIMPISGDIMANKSLTREDMEYINSRGGYAPKRLFLRNTITLSNGDTLSFENISHDLGAVHRTRAFYDIFMRKSEEEATLTLPSLDLSADSLRDYRNSDVLPNKEPVHHVIAIVDSYDAAERFAHRYNIAIKSDGGVFKTNRCTFNFILEESLYLSKRKYEYIAHNMESESVLFTYPNPDSDEPYDNRTYPDIVIRN